LLDYPLCGFSLQPVDSQLAPAIGGLIAFEPKWEQEVENGYR